ncbi:MAG: general secretion pathway protein GspE [Myxococcales bacterium]|nr:general secretion pathway protein GspE [Myxococcales bacterium]
MARKRIGELLLERGVITVQQLEEGLSYHRSSRQRLGVALVQKGFVNEEQLSRALSEALAISEVSLKSQTPDWSAVHLLRARFCESNDLFPFALENSKARKQVMVAMADPLNLPAIEEIEFTTGFKVSPRIAPLSQIRAAILRYYYKVNPDDAPAGKMTVIQPGGVSRVVDTDTKPQEAEEEVIVGVELPPGEVTERTALADLIKKREQQRAQRRGQRSGKGMEAVSKDMDYLFGMGGDESVEKLERKFWALMRIMARKGLITKEEFLNELDEGE